MATRQENILLTGATGNLGAVILEHLLPLGHNINLVLRNAAKAIPHFEAKHPSAVASGQLAYTSIPGLTVPGIFEEPAKKATVIMHIATPLSSTNMEEEMIKPTWDIDLSILQAAKRSGTVKRVIICGTLLQAMRSDTDLYNPDLVVTEERYNDITLEEVKEAMISGYQYAKTNAEKKVWEWVEENGRKGEVLDFDVVMLLPPSIIGRCPQMNWEPTADAAGGNGAVYRALFAGLGEDALKNAFPIIMNNDDVARCHILALDRDKVPGNERYLIASSEILDLRKAVNLLRKEDPELAQRLPGFEEKDGVSESKVAKVDTSKADKVFGTEWKGAVESVGEAVRDVLRWEKENGKNSHAKVDV